MRAIFYWCYLIILVIGISIGWQKIASIENKHWLSMTPLEKKAISNLITDKYFEAYPFCTQAEVRVLEGEYVEIHIRCIEKGC